MSAFLDIVCYNVVEKTRKTDTNSIFGGVKLNLEGANIKTKYWRHT